MAHETHKTLTMAIVKCIKSIFFSWACSLSAATATALRNIDLAMSHHRTGYNEPWPDE